MIEVYLKTDGVQLVNKINSKECTMKECSIAVHALEKIKKILLEMEFEEEFESAQ